MIYTTNIKKGLCIKYNNDFYKVINFLHVNPGKGQAFIRTKLKSLTNGKILENNFPSGHKIQKIDIKSSIFKYLYRDNTDLHFMDIENYNQISINKNSIKNYKFLKEGINLTIIFMKNDKKPISVEIPVNVILKVNYTEPAIKGDTATNATKIATLENGLNIQVPLFINNGEYIKINTETGLYIERNKN